MCSIPTESWQVNAGDPRALSQLLNLPNMIVTHMEYDAYLDYLTIFCRYQDALALCPTCGTPSTQIHQYHARRVRDLAMIGRPCYLEFARRRFKCTTCAVPFTEPLDWLAPGGRLTERYAAYLFAHCRGTSIQVVHQREQVGYKTVEACYYRLAAHQVTTWDAPVQRLGIDEIALARGQDQYVLVISDLDAHRVLTVLPDRTKATLEAYFATWTVAARAAITDVALDLWRPYHLAVTACLPHAQITADRFHVMKLLNNQVTSARREIQRTLPEAEKDHLKGCRWLLVKNQADLTADERVKLAAIGTAVPALHDLHTVKEAFRTIFETAPDRATAVGALEAWIDQALQTGLKRLDTFVTTLRTWWDVILNYFHAGLTSGFVEGMNNKLKLVKRGGFGFRNIEHFRLRVLMECGGLRPPH